MRLDSATRKELYAALLDAFPDGADLELVVSLDLGQNTADIVAPGTVRTQLVLKLILWAEGADRVGDFVRAAAAAKPTNGRLQAVAASLSAGSAAAPAAPTPGATDPSMAQRLFETLVDLDFEVQLKAVRQATANHVAAAFLVHGPTNAYGQRFLTWRLSNMRQWQNARRVPIDIGGNGVEQTPRGLWRAVAGPFNPDLARAVVPDKAAILDTIARAWQTQNLIFILRNVEALLSEPAPPFLAAWIEEFWHQMITRVPAWPAPPPGAPAEQYWLLLILVDYSGRVSRSAVTLAQALDEANYPQWPLCLPPADRFSREALDEWLDRETTRQVLRGALDPQSLLDASDNGVPQLVYEEICRRRDLDFQGALPSWLK